MIAKFKKMLFCLTGFLCSVFIFSISSMPSYAAENSEKQTVSFNLEWIYNNGGSKNHIDSRDVSFTLKSDFLVLGFLDDSVTSDINGNKMTHQSITLMLYSKKDLSSIAFIRPEHVESYSVYEKYGYEDSPSEIIRSSSDDKFPSNVITGGVIPYTGYGNGYDKSFGMNWSGFKLFKDYESLKNYLKTGNEDGLIEPPEDIDTGILDKSIGYLHNIVRNTLIITDENGNPKDSYYKFTWDNTYPKYDSLYKVELSAQCQVGVKSMFGFGKEKTYTSDIKHICDGTYNDLKIQIGNSELKGYFGSFIDTYVPPLASISVGSYRYIFYFRIYVYDESIKNYRFGEWVRMLPDGSVLDGSTTGSGSVGTIDKDGNWVLNPDSDYGTGKDYDHNAGSGSTLDDAEKDLEDGSDFDSTDLSTILPWFLKQLNQMADALGDFPNLINRVIFFIPSPIIAFIGIGIVAVVIMRFLGR